MRGRAAATAWEVHEDRCDAEHAAGENPAQLSFTCKARIARSARQICVFRLNIPALADAAASLQWRSNRTPTSTLYNQRTRSYENSHRLDSGPSQSAACDRRILIAEGHEVVGLTGTALRGRVEGVGMKFRALPAGADFDPQDIHSTVPELKTTPPGPEWLRIAIERVSVDSIPAQHQGLQEALRDFPADVVIGDDMFFGPADAARAALETAPHRSLRHIASALAP